MTYTKKEREQYNEYRKAVCERLKIDENEYNKLRRYGSALRALYVADCNGDIDQEDYALETDRLYKLCDNFCKRLRLNVFYQSDPRGATIYVSKEPIPDNNYTIASCIY